MVSTVVNGPISELKSKSPDFYSFRASKHQRHYISVSPFLVLPVNNGYHCSNWIYALNFIGSDGKMLDIWLHGLRVSPYPSYPSSTETLGERITFFRGTFDVTFNGCSSCR